MHFNLYGLFSLLIAAAIVQAQGIQVNQDAVTSTSSSTSRWPTTVWATSIVGGVTNTYLSTYTQQFSSLYSTFYQPSSGTVGLGSISGEVGTVRVYSTSGAQPAATPLISSVIHYLETKSRLPTLFTLISILCGVFITWI
ncbi:hypothetical protein CANCADRAFT_223 [Tortispora caseinolytica NRRL Y-17796]|uniref:Protein KRE1 n=1 Tax=Tortispora caseinolytica NRRL Y-17796 TaxID=767744 RepID=A0A1E4TIU5_9ASCO|nr:hypothetical protein CANCADRAFT_223 [Tortispora caseinolytica NRRL Y-17796]